MQIKIRAEVNGGATGWVVDPSANDGGGETVDGTTRNLEPGQEVTLTLPDVHDAGGIVVGEVVTPEAPASEAGGEAEGGGEEEPAGDPA